MTEQTVTWATVAALIEARGGRLSGRDGNERHWRVPSPTGGTLTVEVTLGRRWCSIAVDRWRTTDRTDEPSGTWFRDHVWPLVMAAPRDGVLPSGGGSCASAHPIERAALPGLLAAWVDAELTWGMDADEQWPRSAPRGGRGASGTASPAAAGDEPPGHAAPDG